MKVALFPTLILCLLPAAAHAAQPVNGRWLTQDRKAVITIAPCGPQICGRITQLLAPPPKGPPVDQQNPDPKMRSRPLQGLTILSGFLDKGRDWRGRIYSPEEGKDYRAILRRNADGTLNVEGCIAIFCQTQIWHPAR